MTCEVSASLIWVFPVNVFDVVKVSSDREDVRELGDKEKRHLAPGHVTPQVSTYLEVTTKDIKLY